MSPLCAFLVVLYLPSYNLSSLGAHRMGHFLPEVIHFPIMCHVPLYGQSWKLPLIDSLLILFPQPHSQLIVGSLRAGTVPLLLTIVLLNAQHTVGTCDFSLKECSVNLIRTS